MEKMDFSKTMIWDYGLEKGNLQNDAKMGKRGRKGRKRKKKKKKKNRRKY